MAVVGSLVSVLSYLYHDFLRCVNYYIAIRFPSPPPDPHLDNRLHLASFSAILAKIYWPSDPVEAEALPDYAVPRIHYHFV